uniref:Lon protease homolog n=1 Tax=Panagrolaimus sp. ES5 TaxID=591445 RepID=A0AC34GPZ0_9BILA
MLELPILLVTDGVLLPSTRMKIPVRTASNLAMIDSCLFNNKTDPYSRIVIAYKQENGNSKKVFPIGTLASIEQIVCWSTNNSRIQYTLNLMGTARVEIRNINIPLCKVKHLESITGDINQKDEIEFIETAKKLAILFTNEGNSLITKLKIALKDISMAPFDELTDLCMSLLPAVSYPEQLAYLSETDISKRLLMVTRHSKSYLKARSMAVLEIRPEDSKIDENIVNMLEKLRGTRLIVPPNNNNSNPKRGSRKNEIDDLFQNLEAVGLPEGSVKETIMNEFEKFKNTSSNSPEHPVLRSYLQLIADLPWNVSTPDKNNIKESRIQLEAEHEGMESVKKRILEFLAVKQLKQDLKGPILCLAGPPGVGKTSVAKSIATTLGRNFQRLALGGIRDQSDIRGHRRTYVGAMPGRIIHALKLAKSNNPVILLDEIDKLGSGPHGDPSAALLEVLDPEQNNSFTDLYLNVPFDLSKVLFIATANDVKNIPSPLLDRMELVEMSSYSTGEKLKIAKNHIIPKQMSQHALSPDYVSFNNESILNLIEYYTHEAGVRQLERVIGAVCRNVALQVAEDINGGNVEADVFSKKANYPIQITNAEIEKIFGNQKRKKNTNIDEIKKSNEPGIVIGLAWTPVGGEVLVIETVASAGTGKVILTGSLGNVIKESIQVALSFVRANATKYGLDVSQLDKTDLHVHLPAGAIGKDGPSAGCAFTLALFSLISGLNVRKDSAVTGEKSLQIEFVDNVHELIQKMINDPMSEVAAAKGTNPEPMSKL